MEMIDRFSGEHGWLSNFAPGWPIIWNGHDWLTAEHAYQASKAVSVFDYQRVRNTPTPREAKQTGRRIPCRPGWDSEKKTIMLGILIAKFTQHTTLRSLLVATGDARLVEGNTWGDTYWGAVRPGERGFTTEMPYWHTSSLPQLVYAGHNWLGRELMMVRDVLADG